MTEGDPSTFDPSSPLTLRLRSPFVSAQGEGVRIYFAIFGLQISKAGSEFYVTISFSLCFFVPIFLECDGS